MPCEYKPSICRSGKACELNKVHVSIFGSCGFLINLFFCFDKFQIASFHMFMDGAFSSSDDNKYQADSAGLKALTVEKIREGFQVVSRLVVLGKDQVYTLYVDISLSKIIAWRFFFLSNERIIGVVSETFFSCFSCFSL